MKNLIHLSTQILRIEGTLNLAEMSRKELGDLLEILECREKELRERELIPLDLLESASRRTSKVRTFLNEEYTLRLWGLEPWAFCREHLEMEHATIHMINGALRRGRDLTSFAEAGEIDLRNLQQRHWDLVVEFDRRGIKHDTALFLAPDARLSPPGQGLDLDRSRRELSKICVKCAMFIKKPRKRKGRDYYNA